MVSKATAAAASTTASSLKDIAEKTVEKTEKAGKSLKQSIDKTLSDASDLTGKHIHVCVACGVPLRADALFCGKCGQKVMDKVVDEAKDQVKGKVEDKVVEKAKEYLDETPQPKPVPEKKNPRDVLISENDLPKNIVAALEAVGLKTLGDLADRSSEGSKQLTTIKGIGPAAVKTIKKTVKNIPVEKPEEKLEQKPEEKIIEKDKDKEKQSSDTVCRKCGKTLQPDWSFCPYCQTPRQMVCSKCGNEIQADWKYCPFCNTKIK